MPTFLILKRTGSGDLDLKVCAVIRGKSQEEVDEAIKEGATDGVGNYIALSVANKVERKVRMQATVGEADPIPPA